MQLFSIGAAAGAKWFDGEGVMAALTQMSQKQCREQCFAHAGIGGCDEDDARSPGMWHSEELTTDEAA